MHAKLNTKVWFYIEKDTIFYLYTTCYAFKNDINICTKKNLPKNGPYMYFWSNMLFQKCSNNPLFPQYSINAAQRKWRLIAIAVFTLLMIQFLLAYTFYSANHDEEYRIEIWQRRVEALEIAHQKRK